MVGHRIVNRGDGCSIPPTAVSKLRQFRSTHIACVYAMGSKRYHTGTSVVDSLILERMTTPALAQVWANANHLRTETYGP